MRLQKEPHVNFFLSYISPGYGILYDNDTQVIKCNQAKERAKYSQLERHEFLPFPCLIVVIMCSIGQPTIFVSYLYYYSNVRMIVFTKPIVAIFHHYCEIYGFCRTLFIIYTVQHTMHITSTNTVPLRYQSIYETWRVFVLDKSIQCVL